MADISMDNDAKNQQFDEDVEKIVELLDEKSYFKARDAILKYNAVDISEILEEVLEELGVEKTIIIFRMLPKDVSVEVFSHLPSDDQVAIVHGLSLIHILTVNFLYELLSHREGDIRRQAGRLMGNVISGYDDVYRKEIPEGAVKDDINRDEAAELWDTYLHKIVFPDYRVTDQHRSWIGYTLKVVIFGLLEKADRRCV